MGLWRLIAFFFWDLPIAFFELQMREQRQKKVIGSHRQKG
jgi:hypothetical protein